MCRRVLERRIATYPAGEVMFNLLAISGRRTALQQRLAELEAADQSSGEVQAQLMDVRDKLQGIEERLKDWEVEVRSHLLLTSRGLVRSRRRRLSKNTLRRHNYIGLVHALLVEAAKQDKLKPQIEDAKQKMKQKIEEKRRKGEMMDEDD